MGLAAILLLPAAVAGRLMAPAGPGRATLCLMLLSGTLNMAMLGSLALLVLHDPHARKPVQYLGFAFARFQPSENCTYAANGMLDAQG
jgi:hypothetical protein